MWCWGRAWLAQNCTRAQTRTNNAAAVVDDVVGILIVGYEPHIKEMKGYPKPRKR
jgi:hypothetical protein